MAINAALNIVLKFPVGGIERKTNINDLSIDINIHCEDRGLIEIAGLRKNVFAWGLPSEPATIRPTVDCQRSIIRPAHHQITTVLMVLLRTLKRASHLP